MSLQQRIKYINNIIETAAINRDTCRLIKNEYEADAWHQIYRLALDLSINLEHTDYKLNYTKTGRT